MPMAKPMHPLLKEFHTASSKKHYSKSQTLKDLSKMRFTVSYRDMATLEQTYSEETEVWESLGSPSRRPPIVTAANVSYDNYRMNIDISGRERKDIGWIFKMFTFCTKTNAEGFKCIDAKTLDDSIRVMIKRDIKALEKNGQPVPEHAEEYTREERLRAFVGKHTPPKRLQI